MILKLIRRFINASKTEAASICCINNLRSGLCEQRIIFAENGCRGSPQSLSGRTQAMTHPRFPLRARREGFRQLRTGLLSDENAIRSAIISPCAGSIDYRGESRFLKESLPLRTRLRKDRKEQCAYKVGERGGTGSGSRSSV
jgi:hypothetical protein